MLTRNDLLTSEAGDSLSILEMNIIFLASIIFWIQTRDVHLRGTITYIKFLNLVICTEERQDLAMILSDVT